MRTFLTQACRVLILLFLLCWVHSDWLLAVEGAQGDCVSFTAPLGTNDTHLCSTNPLDASQCTLDLLPGYSLATGDLTVGCFGGTLTPLPTTKENPCSLPANPPTGLTAGTCGTLIVSQGNCTYNKQYGYRLVSGSLQLSCYKGQLSSTIPVLSGSLCYDPYISWIPQLAINPISSSIYRSQPVSFTYLQTLAPCNPNLPLDIGYSFVWTVNTIPTAASGASPVQVLTSPTREFAIPKDTLLPFLSYRVTMTVTITSASTGPATPSRRLLASTAAVLSSTIDINVAPSPLISVIAGGDRTRSIDGAMVFDGSQSVEPDGLAALQYSWSCNKQTSGGGLCPSVAGLVLTNPTLSFPANTFPANQNYLFTLRVSTLDGRSASTSIRLATVAAPDPNSPVPLVSILGAPASVNAWEFLELHATVVSFGKTEPKDMSYSWSTDCTNINLNDTRNLASAINADTLTLRPFVRDPVFSTCNFKVVVTDPLYQTSSTAAVAVVCNTAPATGTCSISPNTTNEVELGQTYTVTCSNWFALPASHGPLSYRVYYLESTTVNAFYAAPAGTTPAPLVWRPLTVVSNSNVIQSRMMAGQWRIQVRVTDTAGAETSYLLPQIITVLPKTDAYKLSTNCYLQELISTDMPNLQAEGDTQMLIVFLQSMSLRLASIKTAQVAGDCNKANLVAQVRAAMIGITYPDGLQLATALAALSNSVESRSAPPTATSTTGVTTGVGEMQLLLQRAFSLLQTTPVTDQSINLIRALAQSVSATFTDCTSLPKSLSSLDSLLAIQASQAFDGETLATLDGGANFQATALVGLERKGISATVPGNGVTISLTPDASLVRDTSITTAAQLDSAASVLTLGKSLQLNVISLSTNWTVCQNILANSSSIFIPGFLSSPIVQTSLRMTDGSAISYGIPNGRVGWTMPLSTAAMQSASALSCPAITHKQLAPFVAPVACAMWDSTLGMMSTANCLTISVTAASATCSCTALGSYGLVYDQNSLNNLYSQNCWLLPTVNGTWWPILYLIAYFALAAGSAVQLFRMMPTFGFRAHPWMTASHATIIAYCLLRMLDTLAYIVLYKSIDPSAQTLLHSLPFVLLPWLMTLLLFHWASVIHAKFAEKEKMNEEISRESTAADVKRGSSSTSATAKAAPEVPTVSPPAKPFSASVANPFTRYAVPIMAFDTLTSVAFLALILTEVSSSGADFLLTIERSLLCLVAATLLVLGVVSGVLSYLWNEQRQSSESKYLVKKLGVSFAPNTISPVARHRSILKQPPRPVIIHPQPDEASPENNTAVGGGEEDANPHSSTVGTDDNAVAPDFSPPGAVEEAEENGATSTPKRSDSVTLRINPSSSSSTAVAPVPVVSPISNAAIYLSTLTPLFFALFIADAGLLIVQAYLTTANEKAPHVFVAPYQFVDLLALFVMLGGLAVSVHEETLAWKAEQLRLAEVARQEAERLRKEEEERLRIEKEKADALEAERKAQEERVRLAAEAKAAEEAAIAAAAEEARLIREKEEQRIAQLEREAEEKRQADRALAKALQDAAIADAKARAAMSAQEEMQASVTTSESAAKVAEHMEKQFLRMQTLKTTPHPSSDAAVAATIAVASANAASIVSSGAFLSLKPGQGIKPEAVAEQEAALGLEPDSDDLESDSELGDNEHEIVLEGHAPSAKEIRALEKAALTYTAMTAEAKATAASATSPSVAPVDVNGGKDDEGDDEADEEDEPTPLPLSPGIVASAASPAIGSPSGGSKPSLQRIWSIPATNSANASPALNPAGGSASSSVDFARLSGTFVTPTPTVTVVPPHEAPNAGLLHAKLNQLRMSNEVMKNKYRRQSSTYSPNP